MSKCILLYEEQRSKLFTDLGCSSAKIFLIGMPCSGKSTMGRIIAHNLNYLFIDVDVEITNEIHGSSIKQYIGQHGWQMFRLLELKVFKRVLEKISSSIEHVIISCGGGCVETEEVRHELSQQAYVIYVNRDLDSIREEYSKCEINDRPYMDLDKKFEERKVHYRQCSSYEFCQVKKDHDWKINEANLQQFIKTIIDKKPHLPVADDSFFLCSTYKNVLNVAKDEFASVVHGCDAIELRVDLLESYDIDFIGQQIAYIRKCTSLPIIYTIRSQTSYGTFENNEVTIFELLNYGIRFGCEFIDMEANWSDKIKRDWLHKIKNKHPYIIASLHLKLSAFDLTQVTNQCVGSGQVDVVKIAIDIDDNTSRIEEILEIFAELKTLLKQFDKHKVILIAMGNRGKLTRMLNRFMTPVTHELLPQRAAKGQLTVKQIQQARCALGLIDFKQYYLFGSPIQRSLSPCIHQTGFDYYHLPYKYELCETNDVSFAQKIMNQSDFGGASVSIPLKQDVFELLISDAKNRVSDSAKKIGAVNTVTKLQDGTFYGDNTDWIAIHKLLSEKMVTEGSALIIGAGGTARAALYALTQMEYVQVIYLYNPRTPEKANHLASTYNNPTIIPVTSDAVNKLKQICIVINTLPSSIHFTLDNLFFENISSSNDSSILLDANYVPYQTALIKQAQQYNWRIIYGIDMLIEQGLEQFQIWTGKATAVTPTIKETVRQRYYKTIDLN